MALQRETHSTERVLSASALFVVCLLGIASVLVKDERLVTILTRTGVVVFAAGVSHIVWRLIRRAPMGTQS
jgi:hypothetical protein